MNLIAGYKGTFGHDRSAFLHAAREEYSRIMYSESHVSRFLGVQAVLHDADCGNRRPLSPPLHKLTKHPGRKNHSDGKIFLLCI